MKNEKKCFSTCQKTVKSKCNLPRCVMTNGKKRQYCRLSKTYKLLRSGNNCITKKRLFTKTEASNKIGKMILNKRNNTKKIKEEENERKEANILETIKKNIMARRIKKLVLATPLQRRVYFLKSVCFDSGACLSFGTQIKKINELFNGFTTFDYVEPPIKRIGQPSANGFVNEIQYKRYGYNAYAVLKSTASNSADNLLYEYIVGQYINKINKRFSCFLETYGLFMYKDESSWRHVRDTKTITTNVLTSSILPINIEPMDALSLGCHNSKYLCILIQHINKPQTLSERLDDKDDIACKEFINFQLIYILYQVYLPLSLLASSFTHYDLHRENVLLYTLPNNKYIEYHYHLPLKVVTFKSLYIVKIIDYGRSFFNDIDGNINSKKVYNKLCTRLSCDPDCGAKVGFKWLAKEDYPGANHFIISQKANQSHDLRLLYNLNSNYGHDIEWANTTLSDMMKSVVYDDNYGTKEIKKSGLANGKIYNIMDAVAQLQMIIEKPKRVQAILGFYAKPKYSKYGDIHMYSDGRPMEYIPVK